MATGGHYITMLLADCITRSFCPPVSMVKDAMESIYTSGNHTIIIHRQGKIQNFPLGK